MSLGAALDLFLAAKAAEGVSPRTVEWYRYINGNAVRRFGRERPLDGVGAAELRAWLLELRATMAPESIAGYVRGLKVFGNWCAAEELGTAAGFRALRRPRVPRRIIAPFTDAELQRLLAIAEPRERALILLLLDTGLRLAEVTGLRVGDLRPDGTIRVMGKGSKERIVPIGALQPPHLSPHVRAQLPRQRRRRLQPAADPGPHHPRHDPALCQPDRGRPRREAPGRVARRPAGPRPFDVTDEGMQGSGRRRTGTSQAGIDTRAPGAPLLLGRGMAAWPTARVRWPRTPEWRGRRR